MTDALTVARHGRQPTVLDLFSGAGGMSLGFQMAGYSIALGVEKEELPCKTHRHNFGNHCHHGRVEDITDPDAFIRSHGLDTIDVIVGGPPCQGFSRVGRGKIRDLRNDPTFIHDPRNQCYRDFIRFVQELRPLYFAMENVPDMQYYADENGLIIDQALEQFRGLGYTVDWVVLRAEYYGVPQTRRRLFIIGNRLNQEIVWPKKTHRNRPVTVWQAISDLPVVRHNHRRDEMPYWSRHGWLNAYQRKMREGCSRVLYNHQTRWHNDQDLRAFALLPEGGKYAELPEELKRYRDDIFKDKYWKLHRDRPSWTIEAHIGKDTYRHIYPSRTGGPEQPRTISVREAARLQSFPDRFRFIGPFTRQFMQVGNAVPPLLARAVAHAILPGVLAGMARTGRVVAIQGITNHELALVARAEEVAAPGLGDENRGDEEIAEIATWAGVVLDEGNERLARTQENRREVTVDLPAQMSDDDTLRQAVRVLMEANGEEAIAQVLTDYPILLTDIAQDALFGLAARARAQGDENCGDEEIAVLEPVTEYSSVSTNIGIH